MVRSSDSATRELPLPQIASETRDGVKRERDVSKAPLDKSVAGVGGVAGDGGELFVEGCGY